MVSFTDWYYLFEVAKEVPSENAWHKLVLRELPKINNSKSWTYRGGPQGPLKVFSAFVQALTINSDGSPYATRWLS